MRSTLQQSFTGSPDVSPAFFVKQAERVREAIHATSAANADGLAAARRWFLLAVASLLLAGLFAMVLVVGRVPFIAPYITDAEFFKRCLVVHVNLSLIVWFGAFAAAMFCLLPARRSRPLGQRVGLPVAVAGVVAMMAAAFLPGTAPILSNYVPFIDHPLFAIGVIAFFAGLVINFIQPRLWESAHPAGSSHFLSPEASWGIRASAVAALIAATTFLASWAGTPGDLPAAAYYEFVAWGGGHVLQVANVAAMVAIWLMLLQRLQNRPVIQVRTAFILFGLLILPHFIAPLLTINGTMTALYHRGSTQLMRFGIFPVVSVFLILAIVRLREAHRAGRLPKDLWKNPYFIGFFLSAVMTVIGFILGAMIRSSTTMIPAHYHASIGAVTVAFMAAAYPLLETFGHRIRSIRLRKLIPWQLGCFGVGQLVFALGFAIGGAYGLDRKAYASEQHVASLGEHLGLAIMGFGGLVAMVGGVAFLALMIAAWLPQRARSFSAQQEINTSA
jgi:cytochrome c oxidase subunit I